MSEAESDTLSYLDDQGSYAGSDDDGGGGFCYSSGGTSEYEFNSSSDIDISCLDESPQSVQPGEPLVDLNAIRWEDMERSDELTEQIRSTGDAELPGLLSWKGNLNSPGTDGILPTTAALGAWRGKHFRTLYDLGGRAPAYTGVTVGVIPFCDDFAYPNPRAAANAPDAHRGPAPVNPADPIALHLLRIHFLTAPNYGGDWDPTDRTTHAHRALQKIVDKCRVVPKGGPRTWREGLATADVVGDLALQNTLFGYPLLATTTNHSTICWLMRHGGGRAVNYVDTTKEELPLWSRYSDANILLLCREGWDSGHEVDLWSAPAKLQARNHERKKGRRWTEPKESRTVHIAMLSERGIAHCGPVGLNYLEHGRYPPEGSVFEANNRATANELREWADPIWRLANYKVEPCKEIEDWELSQADLTALKMYAEGREKEERKRQDERLMNTLASIPYDRQGDYLTMRELVGEIVEGCFELKDLDRQIMMELQAEVDAEAARELAAREEESFREHNGANYPAAMGASPTDYRMGSAFTTAAPSCPPCPNDMYPYALTQQPPWVPGYNTIATGGSAFVYPNGVPAADSQHFLNPTAASNEAFWGLPPARRPTCLVHNQLPVQQGVQVGSWNPNYPPASPYPVYEATPPPPGYPGAATSGSEELQEGSAVSTPTPTTRPPPPASSGARERRSWSSHSAPSRSPFVTNISVWEEQRDTTSPPKRSTTPEAVGTGASA